MKSNWGCALSALFFSMAGVSGSAIADSFADPSLSAAAQYKWTGFHLGLNFGGVWRTGNTPVIATPSSVRFTLCCSSGVTSDLTPNSFGSGGVGWVGGGQVGYDIQFATLILGVEADIAASSLHRTVPFQGVSTNTIIFSGTSIGPPVPASVSARLEWLGTLRARAGVTPVDRVMFFVTGGLAYGQAAASTTAAMDGGLGFAWVGSNHIMRVGWTVGGGAEYALTDHVTLRGEYLYYDLGKQSLTGLPMGNFALRLNPYIASSPQFSGSVARVGMNYKF